jgi:hypothetical protein
MTQNVVREQQSEALYTEAPVWIRTILNNASVYADFITDMNRGMNRINNQIADFLSAGDDARARIMVGKKEMLVELLHIVEAYRKEESNAG